MTTILRNKDLARVMKEHAPSYLISEYLDFLNVLAAVIPELILEDRTVKILDLGEFYTKHTKDKVLSAGFNANPIVVKGAKTMGFRVTPSVQKRIRKETLGANSSSTETT